MSRYNISPLSFDEIHTYPLASRPSKVGVGQFAKLGDPHGELLSTIPDILAGHDLREFAGLVRAARDRGKAVIAGLGGHVIKTGVSPILIDLMDRGYITAFAMNGSAMIHDFEIGLAGSTSEDVDATLGSGAFGMAEETGKLINQAINEGASQNIGMGESVGSALDKLQAPYGDKSLLYAALQKSIPVTVHVAIGTDIIHIHPDANGAALGQTSHQDFRLLCSIVRGLDDGGVYINFGSAVILPEVFLKTVTVVRNLGFKLSNFTTANFDFIQHYRPLTNVVKRPVAGGGRGFAFTGHHEIMIPLLAQLILAGE